MVYSYRFGIFSSALWQFIYSYSTYTLTHTALQIHCTHFSMGAWARMVSIVCNNDVVVKRFQWDLAFKVIYKFIDSFSFEGILLNVKESYYFRVYTVLSMCAGQDKKKIVNVSKGALCNSLWESVWYWRIVVWFIGICRYPALLTHLYREHIC